MQQNQYFLHQEPNRTQLLKHYYSSLQQPTLQNIQSQLQATRSRNYQLGASYFEKKYGNSNVYENLMKDLGLQPKQQEYSQKYKPRVRENQKQYEEYLKAKLKQKQRQIKQSLEKNQSKEKPVKRVRIDRQNPWNQKNQKTEIKQKNHYQQTQYVSEFKKFREKKQERIQQKDNQPVSSKPIAKPKKNYMKQLVQKIFKEIDKTNQGYIQKLSLLQYLTQNKKLYDIFNIHQDDACKQLYLFKTQNQQTFTLKEMIKCFCQERQQEENNFGTTQQQNNIMAKGCLLTPATFQSFEKVFKDLDKYSDMIVKRKQFIQKLRESIYVKQILYEPAIYEDKVNRTILLYRVFDKIQEQEYIGNEQQRKAKQYISFNQFKNYFLSQNRENEAERLKKVRFVDFMNRFNAEKNQNTIQTPPQILAILQKIYYLSNRINGYFNTLEFLQKLKKTTDYYENKETTVRRKDPKYGLQQESFQNTINRMIDEAPSFIQFSQLLQYFSRVGRPKQFIKNKIQKEKLMSQNLKGSKIIAQQHRHLIPQENQVLAYDSDPEIYNGSNIKHSRYFNQMNQSQKHIKKQKNIHLEKSRQPMKNINESKFANTLVSMIVDDTNMKSTNNKIRQHSASLNKFQRQNIGQPKITVPEPFSFEYRQLQKNKKKLQQQLSQNQLKNRFKARQIPKAILEVGVYDQMIKENQKKREQIKKNSMIMTLATQKPFSFQNRQKVKARKKNNFQRQEFIFKAKPVPWFCSVDLYKKYTQQDYIMRKQKISKMAQQSLALSKLPPRMQKNQLQKKAKKLREGGDYESNQNKSYQRKIKEPPDFQKLQKLFDEQLQRKKQAIRPTQIKPFKFSQFTREKKLKSQQSQDIKQDANKQKRDPMEVFKKLKQQQPNVRAGSTLKFTQQVQKRRKQMQQQKRKQLQIKKKQEQLKNRQSLKPRLMKSAALNYKEIELNTKLIQKKKNQILQKKRFEQWKNERIQKAKQQPLLIQRPLKKDQKLEKMKKLALISETLNNNGVKGKQKQALFTKQQLNLLKDYQYLKKNKLI